jgi:hypothetical protein
LISAIFVCDECGQPAATVYFVPAFVKDPRLEDGSEHEGRDAGSIDLHAPRISIAGGPVPVTISTQGDSAAAAITALRANDAEKLSNIVGSRRRSGVSVVSGPIAKPIGGRLRNTTKDSSTALRECARRDTDKFSWTRSVPHSTNGAGYALCAISRN